MARPPLAGIEQHYAQVTPTRLAKAYADADYFGRNLRAIEVLLDRDAVESGAAAAGEPWKLYDLGHGYCTYDFFDRCPHRMACAKCAFYEPRTSARAQLIEGKANLLRLRQEIPLLDDERAAVDDGGGHGCTARAPGRRADTRRCPPRRNQAWAELPVLSRRPRVQ